jgi:hypothetical protein
MDLSSFRTSVAAPEPPAGLGLPLQALWWDAKGDWTKAHGCAQDEKTPIGAAVHAYLHRVEGDLSNAGYWYNRAARSVDTGPLSAEWDRLVAELLGASPRRPG